MSDTPKDHNGELADELYELREQVFRQIIKRDRLVFVEGWQLTRAYLRLFAIKECTAYELHTKLLMKPRRAELLAAGKTPTEAEALLEQEFAERHQVWLAQMRYRNAVLDDGKEWPRDRRYFKRLNLYYARAVSLLHPDLYPAADRSQRAQLLEITQAYKEHNLPLLSLKFDLLQLSPLPVYTISDRTELNRERARLRGCLANIAEMLAAIEAEEPYTLRPLLLDPAKCAAKRQELDELIAYLRQKLAE